MWGSFLTISLKNLLTLVLKYSPFTLQQLPTNTKRKQISVAFSVQYVLLIQSSFCRAWKISASTGKKKTTQSYLYLKHLQLLLLNFKHITFEMDKSSSLDCVKEKVNFKQKSVSEADMI